MANSRGRRHEENVARLVNSAREQPLHVGTALLASAEGYTPRANQLIDAAREQLASVSEIAGALGENLPAPKLQSSRRRRRRKRRPGAAQQVKAPGTGEEKAVEAASPDGDGAREAVASEPVAVAEVENAESPEEKNTAPATKDDHKPAPTSEPPKRAAGITTGR